MLFPLISAGVIGAMEEGKLMIKEGKAKKDKLSAEQRAEDRLIRQEGRAYKRDIATEGRADDRQIAKEDRGKETWKKQQEILHGNSVKIERMRLAAAKAEKYQTILGYEFKKGKNEGDSSVNILSTLDQAAGDKVERASIMDKITAMTGKERTALSGDIYRYIIHATKSLGDKVTTVDKASGTPRTQYVAPDLNKLFPNLLKIPQFKDVIAKAYSTAVKAEASNLNSNGNSVTVNGGTLEQTRKPPPNAMPKDFGTFEPQIQAQIKNIVREQPYMFVSAGTEMMHPKSPFIDPNDVNHFLEFLRIKKPSGDPNRSPFRMVNWLGHKNHPPTNTAMSKYLMTRIMKADNPTAEARVVLGHVTNGLSFPPMPVAKQDGSQTWYAKTPERSSPQAQWQMLKKNNKLNARVINQKMIYSSADDLTQIVQTARDLIALKKNGQGSRSQYSGAARRVYNLFSGIFSPDGQLRQLGTMANNVVGGDSEKYFNEVRNAIFNDDYFVGLINDKNRLMARANKEFGIKRLDEPGQMTDDKINFYLEMLAEMSTYLMARILQKDDAKISNADVVQTRTMVKPSYISASVEEGAWIFLGKMGDRHKLASIGFNELNLATYSRREYEAANKLSRLPTHSGFGLDAVRVKMSEHTKKLSRPIAQATNLDFIRPFAVKEGGRQKDLVNKVTYGLLPDSSARKVLGKITSNTGKVSAMLEMSIAQTMKNRKNKLTPVTSKNNILTGTRTITRSLDSNAQAAFALIREAGIAKLMELYKLWEITPYFVRAEDTNGNLTPGVVFVGYNRNKNTIMHSQVYIPSDGTGGDSENRYVQALDFAYAQAAGTGLEQKQVWRKGDMKQKRLEALSKKKKKAQGGVVSHKSSMIPSLRNVVSKHRKVA